MVNFTSLQFIFRFLPIFLLIYYLVPGKWKNLVSVLGSLVFYAFGEPILIVLLLALVGINYYLGHRCFIDAGYENEDFRKKRQTGCFIRILAFDILVLIGFKAVAGVLDAGLFPLGLSFYIFKMISYQIDIYRKEIVAEPTFLECVTYFTLFPQITQGPIMRYEEGETFNEKKVSWDTLEDGLRYFIVGFAMKVALADRIGILFNDLSMYGYQSISSPLAWLGAFAYSFELYFDFWGYSLMAEGIMVAMGYEFIRNFDNPYSSKSVGEFYRRWHITLGSFFRDYVYIPLGGSRVDKKRLAINLMLVWILTGIWHGNGVNYIIWGVLLGGIIVLEKLFYAEKLKNIPVLPHVYIIVLMPLTWVVFAINDLKQLGVYFSRLFPIIPTDAVVNSSDIWQYLSDYWYLFLVAIILCIPKVSELFDKYKKNPVVTVILLCLFWYSVYFSANASANPFMYLKF